MVCYDDLKRWCSAHDRCLNRCKVINEITQDSMVVTCRAGRYRAEIFGDVLAEWRVYDLASVEESLARLSAAFDVLWHTRRLGLLLV